MLDKITENLTEVRKRTPLVQCITNYVTINDCANILLCFGASPAMVEVRSEVEEFAGLISALYINLGTLTVEQKEAAVLAAKTATKRNVPVILDPVALGAITRKLEVTRELLDQAKISVIKGNTGEIKSLAGYSGKVRGVDSVDTGEGAVEACRDLARKYGCVVAATGETDIVSDGDRTCLINNGSSLFTLVTGSGCMVGALAAATAGVNSDYYVSTAAALMAMGLAGEKAARAAEPEQAGAEGGTAEGTAAGDGARRLVRPGTFRVKLFDCIYGLTEDDILKGGRLQCL